MSTVNIAIIGGVVLLILVLLKMRRANAADTPPPSRGRTRGERRRKRGKDAPPAPPEPMPLAAAAGQSAATASPPPTSPPAAEWPPADEPAPGLWPPTAEADPVEWPPAHDATPAPEPAPELSEEPPAPDPGTDEAPTAWAEDEIVTEPGWPLPGEVDVAWSPPPSTDGMGMVPPTVAPVAPQPVAAWNDESAAAEAPPSLDWLSAEPADEAPAWAPLDTEQEPVWAPTADVPEDLEEGFAWGAPAAGEPADEAPAWEPPPSVETGWADEAAGLHDAQSTGEIPAVPTDAYAPEAPGYDPSGERASEPETADAYGPQAPSEPQAAYAPETGYPEPEYAPQPEFAPPVEPGYAMPAEAEYAAQEPEYAPQEPEYAAQEPEYAPQEPQYAPQEPQYAPQEPQYAAAVEPVAETPPAPVPEYGPPAGPDEPRFAVDPDPAPLRVTAEAGFAAAPEVIVAIEPSAPSMPATAWWDEEPPQAEGAVPQTETAAAPVAGEDPALTGRFALGGFAIQPGQQALGGVTFRAELPEAPSTWAVAGTPGGDAAPGTLSLVLDGAINCAAEGLEVVMDPGFAPTTQGFTVRVSALAGGPFAASGSFRVH